MSGFAADCKVGDAHHRYPGHRARREIILCAGATNSPQLLMLSGIGPQDHLRDMGIVLSEINWLEGLAEDSADDGQYSFLLTAAPLKVEEGSGAPVNPVAVK